MMTPMLIDEFFKDLGLRAWAPQRQFVPQLNVIENENEYIVTSELPGLDEKDFEVSLEDNVLRIKGEKKSTFEQEKDHFHRVESHYGSFERALRLPDGVDLEKSKAQFKNGLLTLTISKNKELSKVHKFKIDTH